MIINRKIMDSANVEKPRVLSRRDFLKTATAAAASLAFRPLPPEVEQPQDLFYRIAASKLPEGPAPAPRPDYYSFLGKESALLSVHRALTAAEELETFINTDPAGLQQAKEACRKLVANPAIWTDGLIQPLADKRRIDERLKEMQTIPWETASGDELLRRWFELNRNDRRGLLDAASLEYPLQDTLSASITRWGGESSGRFPTQLVNFSDEDRREVAAVLSSFPEELLAKIVADPTLNVDAHFNLWYGDPEVRFSSRLLEGEILPGSWEFFRLFNIMAHEFGHVLDIFTNKNLWLLLSPAEALRLVTLRTQIAGRYPKLLEDPSPFTQLEGKQQTGLLVERLFKSESPDLLAEPASLRRLASRYGWLIARWTLSSQNLSDDDGKRLLWTSAGASGNLTAVTDAWARYQIESLAETAAALISLRQLRGADLNQWRQEPEPAYFKLMGKALARQGITQVPLSEVFRQSRSNVR